MINESLRSGLMAALTGLKKPVSLDALQAAAHVYLSRHDKELREFDQWLSKNADHLIRQINA